jgi:potassium channel subfamily K
MSTKKKTRALCVCATVWIIFGMLFFRSEGYGPVDSMYSLTQIITTVGYGDIVPKTKHQKIITAIIVLSSTLLMAGVVSHMIDVILDAQAEALVESLRAKEEQIKSSQLTPSSQHKDANRRYLVEDTSRLGKLKLQAVIHAGVFVSFIVVGTLFFGLFESCGCPEDNLGCHPDPNKCEDSGGIERSFVDTFYMAVVTLTTVGYGDIVPQTLIGRIVSAFYMLFGVGSTLNLVGTVTDLLKEAFESDERLKVTKESFMAMDMDGDGNLDRHEFLRLQLVMLGLAQEGELNSIDLQFDLIDSSGDGFISREEFHSFYL